MDPLITAAAITAAASTGQAAATGKMNKKSRQFSRETYAKTKADNIQFWNMQNEYNSPQAQMDRLQKAGLNPNLVYDKGNAIQPAGNISTPDVQPGQFRTPEIANIGTNIVQGYFDTRIKQAQYDNFKAQNTETVNRAINIAADTVLKGKQAGGQELANKLAEMTLFPMAEAAYLDNDKRRADISFTNDANARAAALQSPNLETAMINVARAKFAQTMDKVQMNKMEQEIKNLTSTNQFQKIQNSLAESGVMPGDNLFMRILGEYLGGFLSKSKDYTGLFDEGLRDQETLINITKKLNPFNWFK
jgi:hypothetical protein